METHALNGMRAENLRIDADVQQITERFRAEKFAADLVMRPGLFFEERHFASGGREPESKHGACGTTAYDNVMDRGAHYWSPRFWRPTQRRAGVKP